MLAITALTSTALACLWPTDAADLQDAAVLVSPQAPVTTPLALTADTYLRQGEPNQNFGTELILRVRPTGKNRALLQVDPATLAAAVGGGPVTAARLELTITHNADNWGPNGRDIALHRLTVPWTELGATWNCGVDTVPGNPQAECAPGTAWEMGTAGPNPWEPTPTGTVTITNGRRGVVTFDVTADVAAWLGGTFNAGWILKRVEEGPSGAVEFGARESASPPVLVLTLGPADTARPPVPAGITMPQPVLEVKFPNDTSVVYARNILFVTFDDTTSGTTIQQILERHQGQIIGGYPREGEYEVVIPDPGPTYTALDSIIRTMVQEAGVRRVRALELRTRLELPGRYPNDGAGTTRASWFAPVLGDGARSRVAIRAPLAWGCENGLYGGPAVTLGIIDLLFATQDLDSSVIHTVAPPTFDTAGNSLFGFAPQYDSSRYRNHGTQVLGILAATGDNGAGVAGMVWRSDLWLFPQGAVSAGQLLITIDPVARLAEALRDAADSGIRVFLTSYMVGASADTSAVGRIRRALEGFLAADARNLFVMPTTNNGGTRTVASVQTASDPATTATHRAVAQAMASYGDQILIVGGTDNSGAYYSSTEFWQEGTAVLAPATDILTLDYPAGTAVRSGVSFAAPFVAGVAAQLVGMDSSLSAAHVKDYILRGARFRISASGQLDTAGAVSGAPETVYQLDAYGALTLLSRERPQTTPICGGQLWARDAAIYVDQGGGTPLRTLPVPGATFLALPSLAQGGRSIAVTNFSLLGDTIEAWAVNTMAPYATTVLPGVYARQYLERGTADLMLVDDASGFGLSLTVRGTGTDLTDARLESLVVPPGATGTAEIIRVSPLGDLAAVHSHVDLPTFESINRWDLVRLTDPPQLVGEPIAFLQSPQEPACTTDCPVLAGDVAWSHDSRRGIFALWRWDLLGDEITAVSTRLVGAESSGGAVTLDSGTVAGAWLLHPRFTPDDSLVVAEHPGLVSGDIGPPCQERRREPSGAFAERVGAAREALLADFCSPFSDGPGIFTAPPAVAAAGGGTGARSSLPGPLRSRAATRGLRPRTHH
jgi:hypothetical protein